MKKFVMGFLVGALMCISMTVFADGGLERITAFVRKDLPIMLDGQKIELTNPPLNYCGVPLAILDLF